MSNTAEQVAEQLTADGWELSFLVRDPGGLNRPSKFLVTITRRGLSFATSYSKGSGHRRWKTGYRSYTDNRWMKYYQPGQRVQLTTATVQSNLFDEMTEAEPPTIDEVLYSLNSDAGGVRHGQTFGDWCSELGSDPDSRKAEKEYRGCIEEWQGLIRLGAEFDKLEKLFENY